MHCCCAMLYAMLHAMLLCYAICYGICYAILLWYYAMRSCCAIMLCYYAMLLCYAIMLCYYAMFMLCYYAMLYAMLFCNVLCYADMNAGDFKLCNNIASAAAFAQTLGDLRKHCGSSRSLTTPRRLTPHQAIGLQVCKATANP